MRRRWVQIDGQLVEVSTDYVQEARNHDSVLWNDRIYQDGNDSRFFSRSQHREYMRANNLTTMDDYQGEWREAERRRVEYATGVSSADRKQDIIETIHRLGG